MENKSAEYQALERFVTADKRYQIFRYASTVAGFILLIVVGVILTRVGIEKNRMAVAKAADSNNTYIRTVTREGIRYNTCLLLVTVEQRQRPDVQQRCFDAADLPGGLKKSDFKPFIFEVIKNALAANTTGEVVDQPDLQSDGVSSTSSNSTESSAVSQPNNPQPKSAETPRSSPQPLLVAPPITTPCIQIGALSVC